MCARSVLGLFHYCKIYKTPVKSPKFSAAWSCCKMRRVINDRPNFSVQELHPKSAMLTHLLDWLDNVSQCSNYIIHKFSRTVRWYHVMTCLRKSISDLHSWYYASRVITTYYSTLPSHYKTSLPARSFDLLTRLKRPINPKLSCCILPPKTRRAIIQNIEYKPKM